MALELIQSRTISGKGVLIIPPLTGGRYYILYLSTLRVSSQRSVNFEWSPTRSFYANMTYLRQGYVQRMDTMQFENEQREFIADISGQSLIAQKCVYDGILESFANLGTALGLTVTEVTNSITNYKNVDLRWDELRISAFANTVISAKLYSQTYDTCNPDYVVSDSGGEAPAPVSPTTSTEPIQISSAYNGGNDGGATIPYPGDTTIPCILTVVSTRSDMPGVEETGTATVPNASYTTAYRDVVGPGATYFVRCNGNQGVITLAGPFDPGGIVITYIRQSNSCAL